MSELPISTKDTVAFFRYQIISEMLTEFCTNMDTITAAFHKIAEFMLNIKVMK